MSFERINTGFNSVFEEGGLSIGLVVPIENYALKNTPSLQAHLQRAQLAEHLGFKAIWLRDVPFNVPSFGDAGQTFDPFTYLGFLAGQTEKIALGVASIAIPLRHPLHVAKSAATVDQLSGGRLILGIASGDRYEEYPAMNVAHEERGELFREAYAYLRKVQEGFPILKENQYGTLNGAIDVLPKATGTKLPLLITGNSRQSPEWIAAHGDGWMYYPRNSRMLYEHIQEWRAKVRGNQVHQKPFLMPLYVDLQSDNDFRPQPIHLGIRTGIHYLVDYLRELQGIGVNHVALNLRFNAAPIEPILEKLAKELLPHFHINHSQKTEA